MKKKSLVLVLAMAVMLSLVFGSTSCFAADNHPTTLVGKSTKYYNTEIKTKGNGNTGYVMCTAKVYYKTSSDKKNKKNPCGCKVVSIKKDTHTKFDPTTKLLIKLSTFNCAWNKPVYEKANKRYRVTALVTWKWPEEQKPVRNTFNFYFK